MGNLLIYRERILRVILGVVIAAELFIVPSWLLTFHTLQVWTALAIGLSNTLVLVMALASMWLLRRQRVELACLLLQAIALTDIAVILWVAPERWLFVGRSAMFVMAFVSLALSNGTGGWMWVIGYGLVYTTSVFIRDSWIPPDYDRVGWLREVQEYLVPLAALLAIVLLSRITTQELRAALERARQAIASLTQANKEMEMFSYSVSHDLKTPLRAITGFSQILVKQSLPPEQMVDYLSRIHRAAQHMGYLIEALLAFARMSRQELVRKPLLMESIIRRVWGSLNIENQDRSVKFHIHPMPLAYGDERLVEWVYTNLLHNALKFSREREVIEIQAGLKDGAFFVQDNGVGFDMALAGKLFSAFQRLHPESRFEGTGIGLAIVQRIIHRHGGKVWATGVPDAGATFYFTLGPQQEET